MKKKTASSCSFVLHNLEDRGRWSESSGYQCNAMHVGRLDR